jgi:DNA-binding NtrC family response regulator
LSRKRHKWRVLIAELDVPIAMLLRAAVCRAVDCEVSFAHDRDTAAAALQSRSFDLVLLDVGMYSDGLDTLEKIKDRNALCEVIALTTGVIQAPLIQHLARADVYAVVTKPFDVEQLLTIVTEALRQDRVAEPHQPLVFRSAGDEPTRN